MVEMSQWGVVVEGVRLEEEEEEEEEEEDEEEADDDVRGAEVRVHCCSKNVETCVSHALLGVSSRMRTRSKRESRGVAMAVLVDRSAARS